MPFDLSIGPDDVDGIIAALKTAFYTGLLCCLIAALLVAFDRFDIWRKERSSPVGQIERGKRHFGGL